MKQALIPGLLFILSSCGFNFMFLHPWKLKQDSVITYKKKDADSLVLRFEGHTPTFYIKDLAQADTTYSIQSDFIVNSHDDSLNVWWIKPTGPANGKTIFFLHGNAANLAYQYQGMVPFVRDGYQVVALDYSGFGFSQGKAKRKFLLDDAREAFEILMNDEVVKEEQIIVYGQSLGGHLSTIVASEFEDKIDLLVTEGAFASHKDVASDVAGIAGRIFVKEGYSGKKAIADFKKPYLIVHSTDDKVVPYWHANELLASTNNRASLLTIDQCHICGPQYHYDTIRSSMESLLTKKGLQ